MSSGLYLETLSCHLRTSTGLCKEAVLFGKTKSKAIGRLCPLAPRPATTSTQIGIVSVKRTISPQAKVHQQYDNAPYPNLPIETAPDTSLNALFLHSLVTPYYLQHRQVPTTQDKLILDAGCGSGFKALVLAAANPGAKIIGVDLSAKSVELCYQRFQHHGYDNAEFHVLSLEDLPQLGMTFDYINCDEVLYLFAQPTVGLRTLRSVLKTDGILRTNLHSFYQRSSYYRSQTLFKALGLFEQNPQQPEIACVVETMQALRDQTLLKSQTWEEHYASEAEGVLMNYLIQSDRGYTIPKLFSMLRETDLTFINMVRWRQWQVTDLFEGGPPKMPAFWQQTLANASIEERLHFYELLNPVHRLLDFWCSRPQTNAPRLPLQQWKPQDWQQAQVHLHPQLNCERVRQNLIHCITNQLPFVLSQYISVPRMTPCVLQVEAAATLLPLWDNHQSIPQLIQRRLQLRPTDLVNLEPVSEENASAYVTQLITWLEKSLYVLVDGP